MRKLLLSTLLLLVVSVPAAAQSSRPVADGDTHFGWADVLRVDPIYQTVRVDRPRQECYDQPVVRRESGNHTAGTVLGAVVGGVLGNTVGKGDGRKAATVAGAVAGGAIGNGVARRNDRSYESTETRCENVSSVSEERHVAGYDVEYRYRGEVYVSRLGYDPGERLRVRVNVSPAE